MAIQQIYLVFALAFLQVILVSGTAIKCKTKNVGIIGGHNVRVEDAPYMVGLYYERGHSNSKTPKYEAFCGGSIIHERFVLTAAHCPYFINMFFGNPRKRALIGSDRLDDGGMFIDVEEEFCYKSFGFNHLYDDICVLKLKEPIPLGCKAAKVQLPGKDFNLDEGTMVNVTGFGDLGNNKGMNNELRQTTVPIESDECCHQMYPEVNATQLCAGARGHDSCKGDSGGPLTYNGIQVGVVSYGDYCKDSQGGVYTRVSSYLDWINGIIEDNE